MHYHGHLNLETLLRHKWNHEVLEFYIYLIIRNIAFLMGVLFIPIYLYANLGYSLLEISIYYFIVTFFFSIFIPLTGPLINKLGIKHTIALHLPFTALYWFLLRYLSGNFVSDLWIIVPMFLVYCFAKAPNG